MFCSSRMAGLPFAIVVYLVSLGIWASEGIAFLLPQPGPPSLWVFVTSSHSSLSASQPRPALHQAPSAKAGEVSATSRRQAAGAPVHLFSGTSVITWQSVRAGSAAPVATGTSSRPPPPASGHAGGRAAPGAPCRVRLVPGPWGRTGQRAPRWHSACCGGR